MPGTCKVKAHTRNGHKVKSHTRSTTNKGVRKMFPGTTAKGNHYARVRELRGLIKATGAHIGSDKYANSHMSNGYKKHKLE